MLTIREKNGKTDIIQNNKYELEATKYKIFSSLFLILFFSKDISSFCYYLIILLFAYFLSLGEYGIKTEVSIDNQELKIITSTGKKICLLKEIEEVLIEKKSGRSNTIAGRSFVLKIKSKRDKLHLEEIIFSTSSSNKKEFYFSMLLYKANKIRRYS